MNKELDRYISKRIAIISLGRRGGREDLHEHVLFAAEEAAGQEPVTKAHVDAAIAGLGTPAEIRKTFFPRRERKLPAWAAVAFVVATLLAALDAFSSRSATCSGNDGVVRCFVQVGDGLMASLLSIMPPLLVLTSHFFGPRWLPTALASAWLLLFIVPSVAEGGIADYVGTIAAGAITVSVAAIRWRQESPT